MKKIYFFAFLFLIRMIVAQENLVFKTAHSVNTYVGGDINSTKFLSNLDQITLFNTNGPYTFDGETITTVGYSDMFIQRSKKDSNTKIWRTAITGGEKSYIQPIEMTIDKDDNIYIVANFTGSIDINGTIHHSAADKNSIIIKVSQDGQMLWGITFFGTSRYNSYVKMAVTDNNLAVYYNSYQKILLNKNNGTILLDNLENSYSVYDIKAFGDKLYIWGRTANVPYTFSNFTVPVFTDFLIQADELLNKQNILSFKSNSSYLPQIKNFFVAEDSSVYVLLNTNYSTANPTVAESNTGLKISAITEVPQNGVQYVIGNFSSDFSTSAWFKANVTGSNLIDFRIFPGRNNSVAVYFTNSFYTEVRFGTISIPMTDNTFLKINRQGNYEGKEILGQNFSIYERSEYKYDTNYNYFVSTGNKQDFYYTNNKSTTYRIAINSEQFSPFLEHYATNLFGTVNSEDFIKQNENGDIYSSIKIIGHAANFFGDSFSTQRPSLIFSKISKTGTLEWKTKAENILFNTWESTRNIPRKSDISKDGEIISALECRNLAGICTFTDSNQENVTFEKTALISKLDANGRFIWKNELSSQILNPLNISTYYDQLGNVILVGNTNGNLYYKNQSYSITSSNTWAWDNTFIMKLNGNGDVLFYKSFPYALYSKGIIKTDKDNNIYLFANFADTQNKLVFDGLELNSTDNNINKYVMLKMSSNGQVLAGKNLTPTGENYGEPYIALDVITDNEDNFILYGNTNTSKNLLNQTTVNPYFPNGASALITSLISKVSKDTNVLWSRPMFFSSSRGGIDSNYKIPKFLAVDAQNNIIIKDNYNGKITYNNIEISQGNPINPNLINANLLKLNSDGDMIYNKNMELASYEINLDLMGNDNIILTSSVATQKIPSTVASMLGGYNLYILTLEEEELVTQDIPKGTFSIYPNPTSDFITIDTKEKINSVEIYDSAGRKLTAEFNSNNQIDVRKLINGVYYIRITTDKNNLISKFIKK
ncbi:MAG: T9SS type A sorting domain-containing protein [Chryseobacterium sp.]|nr:T9SS type A sorting domain-containing protein [Chryseobacterium sp.]